MNYSGAKTHCNDEDLGVEPSDENDEPPECGG
jgi:hypothetical protein